MILMVARDRVGSGFMPSPGRIITIYILRIAAIYISIITRRENGPKNSIQ